MIRFETLIFIVLLFAHVGSAQHSSENDSTQRPIYPIVSLLDRNCLMGSLQDGVRMSDAEAALCLTGTNLERPFITFIKTVQSSFSFAVAEWRGVTGHKQRTPME